MDEIVDGGKPPQRRTDRESSQAARGPRARIEPFAATDPRKDMFWRGLKPLTKSALITLASDLLEARAALGAQAEPGAEDAVDTEIFTPQVLEAIGAIRTGEAKLLKYCYLAAHMTPSMDILSPNIRTHLSDMLLRSQAELALYPAHYTALGDVARKDPESPAARSYTRLRALVEAATCEAQERLQPLPSPSLSR